MSKRSTVSCWAKARSNRCSQTGFVFWSQNQSTPSEPVANDFWLVSCMTDRVTGNIKIDQNMEYSKHLKTSLFRISKQRNKTNPLESGNQPTEIKTTMKNEPEAKKTLNHFYPLENCENCSITSLCCPWSSKSRCFQDPTWRRKVFQRSEEAPVRWLGRLVGCQMRFARASFMCKHALLIIVLFL